MSAEQVANAFVPHFYKSFSTGQLASLYSPQSMLTFEGQQFMGAEAIVHKLTSLGSVQHDVKSIDIQPGKDQNSLLIFVTGTVRIDNGNPLHFCETFQLSATAPNQYYIHNDFFRLNYGL